MVENSTHKGFFISGLCAPWTDWGDLIKEFLSANRAVNLLLICTGRPRVVNRLSMGGRRVTADRRYENGESGDYSQDIFNETCRLFSGCRNYCLSDPFRSDAGVFR